MVCVIQIVHSFIFFFSFRFTSGEFVDMSYDTNFINATLICNQNGGQVAPPENWPFIDSNGREIDHFWTPKIYLRTPFIASKGCYKDLITTGSYHVGKGDTSVATCFAHCHPSDKFALSGEYCSCPSADMKIKEEKRVNASLCNGYNVNNKTYRMVYIVLPDPVGAQGDEKGGDLFKVYKCRYTRIYVLITQSPLGKSPVKQGEAAANFNPTCNLNEANIPWQYVKCTVTDSLHSWKNVSCEEKEYIFLCKIDKNQSTNNHSEADGAAPESKTTIMIVVFVVCLLACGITCAAIFYFKRKNHHMRDLDEEGGKIDLGESRNVAESLIGVEGRDTGCSHSVSEEI